MTETKEITRRKHNLAKLGVMAIMGVVAIRFVGVPFQFLPPQTTAKTIPHFPVSKCHRISFQPNRTIALIHVGKAGGLTVRAMTSLKCRIPRSIDPETLQRCLDEEFPQHNASTLALQTIYYAHLNSIPTNELQAATSFLLPLRNPVDRVVSAFQYSHPGNCRDAVLLPNSTKGCTNHFMLQQTTADLSILQRNRAGRDFLKRQFALQNLFVHCFPDANVEVFAHSVLSPWKDVKLPSGGTKSVHECRRLARRYVSGQGPMFPIPHLHHNYEFYLSRAIEPFYNLSGRPKEFFAIRTDHLWEDFEALNDQLSTVHQQSQHPTARGEQHVVPVGDKIHVSHGSEVYATQQSKHLSSEAYHKLCCVLENEIAIYQSLVERVENLDTGTKQETMRSLAESCGLTVGESSATRQGVQWMEWRTTCKERLQHDQQELGSGRET